MPTVTIQEAQNRLSDLVLQPVAIGAMSGGNKTVGAFETNVSLLGDCSEPTGRNSE